jgi:hypothetical protein
VVRSRRSYECTLPLKLTERSPLLTSPAVEGSSAHARVFTERLDVVSHNRLPERAYTRGVQ